MNFYVKYLFYLYYRNILKLSPEVHFIHRSKGCRNALFGAANLKNEERQLGRKLLKRLSYYTSSL